MDDVDGVDDEGEEVAVDMEEFDCDDGSGTGRPRRSRRTTGPTSITTKSTSHSATMPMVMSTPRQRDDGRGGDDQDKTVVVGVRVVSDALGSEQVRTGGSGRSRWSGWVMVMGLGLGVGFVFMGV